MEEWKHVKSGHTKKNNLHLGLYKIKLLVRYIGETEYILHF